MGEMILFTEEKINAIAAWPLRAAAATG